MAVTIDSTRFGAVEIPAEAVIEFPNGLIGLGGSRYTLIEREESSPFLWLHSLEDPSLALPVTDPRNFFRSYTVEISATELARVGVAVEEAELYVTVRAAEAIEDFRANLRAPILVTAGRGHQVINEAEGTSVRAPLFSELALEQVA